tara:strand:- start:3686 stop:4027 length:342 start_codon:yes stop_codon:yes gene_type:complete
MKALTKDIRAKLIKNRELMADPNYDNNGETKPVVKLFVCVGGNATWLLSDMDEDGLAFGLCDLGLGFPELGYVDVNELEAELGWRLERDMHWTATKSLRDYAQDAYAAGRVVA